MENYYINYNHLIEPLYGSKRNDRVDIILLENNVLPHKYCITKRVDMTKYDVYSIDPQGSRDFDDAFSIKKMGDEILLSIYISNVCLWMDVMDLWGSFSKRIATIYLPDRKRPMLPTILSDALCSLLEKNIRFAFTLDCVIKNGIIVKSDFKNTSVVLKKNHIYDSDELNKNKDYKLLFETITKMNTIENQEYISRGKIESNRKIKDSHDIIAYIIFIIFCRKIRHNCGKLNQNL